MSTSMSSTNGYQENDDLPNGTSINGLITDLPIPDSGDPELFDPDCDPSHPVRINYQDVAAAHYRIHRGIECTPCKNSKLSKAIDVHLYLKMDFLQVTGSFKERGARNYLSLIPQTGRKRGVITSSAGNHAQALGYHGRELGIPVTVVMPTRAPMMKVENCVALGANVILKGIDMSEAKPYAMKVGKVNNIPYCDGYDHPAIIAGQGTVALEILEQVPNVDAIIVPVGGGGLIAGVAAAVKELRPEVKGVEPDRSAAFSASLKCGKPFYVPSEQTIADGLAVSAVGVNALHTCLGLIDKMIQVDEASIHRAIVRLLEVEKFVVEGGGAASVAVFMADLVPELKGKRVVSILTGGNIDTTILGRVLERGLAFEGRMCRFTVLVSDRPGGIAELCGLLGGLGVSIKDIFHERAWIHSSVYNVQVKLVCETRDANHAAELERVLRQHYDHVVWGASAV
ncbi:unnamed protein product [Dicrocoelium dendriticum]|nr:unnamed protein product [Dicrocoelium dendriticum]